MLNSAPNKKFLCFYLYVTWIFRIFAGELIQLPNG